MEDRKEISRRYPSQFFSALYMTMYTNVYKREEGKENSLHTMMQARKRTYATELSQWLNKRLS